MQSSGRASTITNSTSVKGSVTVWEEVSNVLTFPNLTDTCFQATAHNETGNGLPRSAKPGEEALAICPYLTDMSLESYLAEMSLELSS